MKKITLAVLFGGSSTEYEISLQSAHAVLTHLDRDRYEPVLLGITRDGRWLLYQGPVDALLDDTWHTDARHTVPAVISPDRGVHGLLLIAPAGPSTRYLDAAFPVLHGKNGEDGTVQGLLELAGIPVVGCGVLASALCMDKDVAHRLVQAAGVAVPPSILFRAGEGLDTLPERTASLTYPLFVKPARAGSSFGITKVEEPGVLAEAVAAALAHDSKVVIEEAVPGFEVGCAVLGNEVLTVGHGGRDRALRRFFQLHGEVRPDHLQHTHARPNFPGEGNRNSGDRPVDLPGAGVFRLCTGGFVSHAGRAHCL